MESKLIKDGVFLRKVADSYVLHRVKDGVLTIEGDSQYTIDGIEPFYKLAISNCQEIERGYDLDELSKEKYPYKKTEMFSCFELDCKQEGFIEGFQKALEILGDNRFSEEDMLRAYNQGGNDGAQFESMMDYDSEDNDETLEFSEKAEKEFIQSLQQTEWDVEIEMGNTPIWENSDVQGHVVCKKCGEWNESQIIPYNCKCVSKPKLDANGCLILKRK